MELFFTSVRSTKHEFLYRDVISFQIVRADMKELVDFDLQGAPYGYTPFCESRKEMDGFRYVQTFLISCRK